MNYAYDAVGNREDIVDATLYDYGANHRLTTRPSQTYGYDNDGNTTSRTDGVTPALRKKCSKQRKQSREEGGTAYIIT